jgi:cell pole-organizing protein PopZ
MAKAPGQNATVEEILASIRQAISDDDAKRTAERMPQTPAERRAPASAPDPAPEKDSEPADDFDVFAEAASNDPHPDHDVIEQAIEQAIDGVRAELEHGRTILSRSRGRPGEQFGGQRALPRTVRPAPVRPAPVPRREVAAPAQRRALLSSRAETKVSASFDDLAKAMIDGNPRQLDAVVEELLRPMLKGWLEDNLPQMVERLVREEIERVSRGRR